MKLKVTSKNYRAVYWFSPPFAYKRKREEVSPSVWEVARSARGAGLAQHITACCKHDVMFCAKLTTEQSHHYSARWCAVIRFKRIKVVWGKTRVFPHMRHITSVELSSQTVQWTVCGNSYTSQTHFVCLPGTHFAAIRIYYIAGIVFLRPETAKTARRCSDEIFHYKYTFDDPGGENTALPGGKRNKEYS